jgi:hypothetical protein
MNVLILMLCNLGYFLNLVKTSKTNYFYSYYKFYVLSILTFLLNYLNLIKIMFKTVLLQESILYIIVIK